MELGRLIGEGGNSEVFEWGNSSKVIKLAKPNTNKFALQREFKNNLIAWAMGLSVPQPFEIVEYDQRPGIVFERIDGDTLTQRLFKTLMIHMNEDGRQIDWRDIRDTARLLSEIHQFSHEEMPSQRDALKYQIQRKNYLNEDEKEAVIRILDHLPVKNNICHGDPNPHNIVISNGELVIIDWNDATIGNPEADIAEFILVIQFTILPPHTPENIVQLFDSLRDTIINVFMEAYTSFTDTTYNEIDHWIVPIAARKLHSDAISDEEKQLLVNEIRSRISKKTKT